MTKIELIDKLKDLMNDLDTMIVYLDDPFYSDLPNYRNRPLAGHIDIYKFTPSEMLDVMEELSRSYGEDTLYQTATEYKQYEEQKEEVK